MDKDGILKWKESFLNPERKYRSRPFWSWNDVLTADEIVRQVREMADKKMGGFFMHSREGLETPYMSEQWFACIIAAAEEAKKHQMTAWLYDEDRWPSGTAAGTVPAMGDRNRLKGLTLEVQELSAENLTALQKNGLETDGACDKLPEGGIVLAVYAAKTEGENLLNLCRLSLTEETVTGNALLIVRLERSAPSEWFQNETPPDNLNPETVKDFLRKTHEVYYEKTGEYFGTVIPGIFTDEPSLADRHAAFPKNRGWIPWTFGFSKYYREKWGQDVFETLPYLYFNGEGSSAARYRYWKTVSDRFTESYSRQISEWCRAHGIAYTGHFLQEFRMGLCARVNGSVMPHYRYQDVPGIDMLGEDTCEYLTVKQCASVAHQYGKREVMTETYGCTGWDFSFEGMKWIGDWQYALGVNARCPHLAWYSMRGMRKRDYPPCFSYQNTWWEKYAVTEDYFARLGMTLQEGEPVRKLLVIHSIGTAWSRLGCSPYGNPDRGKERDVPRINEYGLCFNSLLEELSRQHIDYDLGDETLMEADGSVKEALVYVKDAPYQAVLVPSADTLSMSTIRILTEFAEHGGSILFLEPVPYLVEGEEDKCGALSRLLKHSQSGVYENLHQAVSMLECLEVRSVSLHDQNGYQIRSVLSQLRRTEDGGILFLANNDRERSASFKAEVNLSDLGVTEKIEVMLLEANLLTGEIVRRDACAADGRLMFHCELKGCGSVLYRIVIADAGTEDDWQTVKRPGAAGRVVTCSNTARIAMSHSNAYVFDTCRWRFADDRGQGWSEPMEIWQAQREIRRALGMRKNDSSEDIQRYSWVCRDDLKPGRRIELKFEVYLEERPNSRYRFAAEGLETMELAVNGKMQKVQADEYLLDRSIAVTELQDVLQEGENGIIVSVEYQETSELEMCYLLGDFAVYKSMHGRVIRKKKSELTLGDWTAQGLLHYAGSVVYQYHLSIPKEKIKGKKMLVMGAFEGACASVRLNGMIYEVPWRAAGEIVLEEGVLKAENDLEIEIWAGPRNLLGPFHLAGMKPKSINGACFMVSGANHTASYQTVPYGLMQAPGIREVI